MNEENSSDSDIIKFMERKFSELMSRIAKEENSWKFNYYDKEAGVKLSMFKISGLPNKFESKYVQAYVEVIDTKAS